MTYRLTLYVTGHSAASQRAIHNLRRIVESEMLGTHEVVIVDVLERPQVAEDEKILATPTLIKESPPPVRRIIGDLSDTQKVLLGLDLESMKHEESAT